MTVDEDRRRGENVGGETTRSNDDGDNGELTPEVDAERESDIERKQKKLKKTALIAQCFCGALALAMIIVLIVVACR